MKTATICSLLLAVCLAASAQDSGDTISVNVRLVNVFVTVTDNRGAPVAGLKKENFSLKEDDQRTKNLHLRQRIGTPAFDRPWHRYQPEYAQRPASGTGLRAPLCQDHLASGGWLCRIYEFSEVVNELTPFTSDEKRIDRAIGGIQYGAATALYDALYLGSQALEKRQGRKVIVVITDGGDTVSTVSYKEAVREAQQAEAIVYSIIIVPIEASAGRDTGGEHALIQLSEDTGGRYYYASSESQLDTAFRQISEELRTQYLLAYYPSRKLSDSSFLAANDTKCWYTELPFLSKFVIGAGITIPRHDQPELKKPTPSHFTICHIGFTHIPKFI